MNKLRKNDIVKFIPEYKDKGDEFDYILTEDPDGGRVKVMPINSGLEFPPIQVVKTEWLIKTGNYKGGKCYLAAFPCVNKNSM